MELAQSVLDRDGMRGWVGWLFALTASTASTAHAGGFLIAAPPARVDLAPTAMVNAGETSAGYQLKAGLHWASLSSNTRTPIDIGFGVVLENLQPEVVPLEEKDKSGELVTSSFIERPRQIRGSYVELAVRTFGSRHRRAWLGVRLDVLRARFSDRSKTGLGVTGRASWELVGGVSGAGGGGGGGGVIHGSFALGMFFEAGIRQLPGEPASMVSTAGLTGRLPFFVFGG